MCNCCSRRSTIRERSGRPKPVRHPVPLKAVLARLTENAQSLAAVHRVRVTLEAPDDLPAVVAEEAQLELALMNLMTNAIVAMPGGGHLTLSAAADPAGIVIEVRDTGAGIPPELLGRVFEPWVTTKAPGPGTGLGLSIARDVVVGARGTIAIEPGGSGGTVVRVTLPAAAVGQ